MRRLTQINFSLYKALKVERKRIRRSIRKLKADVARRASADRFDKAFGHASVIVKRMASASASPAFQHRGSVKLEIPKSFSIIDSPEQTIDALAQFAKAAHAQRLGMVYVDYGKLENYDLGANGLLDVLVDELSIENRRSRRTVRWRGRFPKDPAHIRFIRALGVIKRLRIEHEYPSEEDAKKLEIFDYRCKHYIREVRPRQADTKSRITQEFADHINRCLGRIGKALTPLALSNLCTYVGEVIDNAEQHSGMLDWAIQGYLDTMVENPMCEIVIFNFGKSIAETFQALRPETFAYKQVTRYVELHAKRGFFKRDWKREDLFTLIALQGHVSSKNETEQDTRGNGTVELIELFQKVHEECAIDESAKATMVILSGSTALLFDGRYKMKPNDRGVKIIAFNGDNDLTQRPDAQYVRTLRGVAFPGTLISLKFPLSTDRSTVPVESSVP